MKAGRAKNRLGQGEVVMRIGNPQSFDRRNEGRLKDTVQCRRVEANEEEETPSSQVLKTSRWKGGHETNGTAAERV